MAVSYTWDVKTVNTYKSHTDKQDPPNTESDVIYHVHWILKGVEGSHEGSAYGSIDLDVTDLSSFTAFSSVNTSTVQGWVESALGSSKVTSLKAKIKADITEKKTPTTELKTIGE